MLFSPCLPVCGIIGRQRIGKMMIDIAAREGQEPLRPSRAEPSGRGVRQSGVCRSRLKWAERAATPGPRLKSRLAKQRKQKLSNQKLSESVLVISAATRLCSAFATCLDRGDEVEAPLLFSSSFYVNSLRGLFV